MHTLGQLVYGFLCSSTSLRRANACAFMCKYYIYLDTCDCVLFHAMLSSDVDSLVREIVKAEPLISEHREQQVQTLIKSVYYWASACGSLVRCSVPSSYLIELQQKLAEPANEKYYLFKVSICTSGVIHDLCHDAGIAPCCIGAESSYTSSYKCGI